MKSLILWMMQTDRNQRPRTIEDVTSYLTISINVDEETIICNKNDVGSTNESISIKHFPKNEYGCIKTILFLIIFIASDLTSETIFPAFSLDSII